ncbi:Glucose-methanol-choline oxidoreductase [Gracilaria domingensis]|nr:Glucose-methanol-choline oxidoreductase [Gracilaria domingensis]
MQWVAPQAGTVEQWGIDGLNTSSSQPFYKRTFNQIQFAAQTGDLRFSYAGEYLQAAAEAGYPENLDPFDDNSNTRNMFENLLAVDSKGFRRDSCTAYLTPVINTTCRHNLKLVQGVTVSKILFTESRPLVATGVEYYHTKDVNMSRKGEICARKEVIISAGPFGSPKLLQLSGLAPRKVLRRAGIKVRAALRVGVRTQSRNFISISSLYTGVPLEPANNVTLVNSTESVRMFWAGEGGVQAKGSFFANGRDKRNAYLTGTGSFSEAALGIPLLSSNCNGNVNSYGFVRVRNQNPFAKPDVQHGLLTRLKDVRRLERCLKTLVEIHRKLPARMNATIVDPVGGEISEEWIRNNAGWAGHFVGGCRVGHVLDGELRVRKTKRLRVVDSSSLRKLPTSAGPMGSVYMLAEYMADVIAKKETKAIRRTAGRRDRSRRDPVGWY